MSDSVRPHRWQTMRLPHPWDSPGKNTGVDCHFLLQCMKVKSESEVTQSCPTLGDPMDCSLPGSSIHGIFPGKSTGVGCHCLLHETNLRPSKSHKSSFKRARPAAKLGTTLAFLVEVGRHLVEYGGPGMLQTSPLALAFP